MKNADAWALQRKRSVSSWPWCWSRWTTHWRRLLIMSTSPPSTLPRGQSCHCHGCPVCGNIFYLWGSQANICAWNSWDKHSAEIPQCLDGLPAGHHFLSWPTAGLTWKDFFQFWIELFVKSEKRGESDSRITDGKVCKRKTRHLARLFLHSEEIYKSPWLTVACLFICCLIDLNICCIYVWCRWFCYHHNHYQLNFSYGVNFYKILQIHRIKMRIKAIKIFCAII